MVIDSHVHDRDFEESRKETVAHALEVTRDSGVSGIFVMLNTRPAIIFKHIKFYFVKLYKISSYIISPNNYCF